MFNRHPCKILRVGNYSNNGVIIENRERLEEIIERNKSLESIPLWLTHDPEVAEVIKAGHMDTKSMSIDDDDWLWMDALVRQELDNKEIIKVDGLSVGIDMSNNDLYHVALVPNPRVPGARMFWDIKLMSNQTMQIFDAPMWAEGEEFMATLSAKDQVLLRRLLSVLSADGVCEICGTECDGKLCDMCKMEDAEAVEEMAQVEPEIVDVDPEMIVKGTPTEIIEDIAREHDEPDADNIGDLIDEVDPDDDDKIDTEDEEEIKGKMSTMSEVDPQIEILEAKLSELSIQKEQRIAELKSKLVAEKSNALLNKYVSQGVKPEIAKVLSKHISLFEEEISTLGDNDKNLELKNDLLTILEMSKGAIKMVGALPRNDDKPTSPDPVTRLSGRTQEIKSERGISECEAMKIAMMEIKNK